MFKLKIVLLSLGICLLVSPSFLFAADETLTITTYYPSPYGSYNQFKVASNTWLAYSSGSVGIGTTSPVAKLHVSGGKMGIASTSGSWGQFHLGNTSDAEATMMFAAGLTESTLGSTNPTATYKWIVGIGPYSIGTDKFAISNPNLAGTTALSILYSNGNVGIGTVSPGAKLDVAGVMRTNSGTPLEFTSIGAGTYDKMVLYHDATYGLMIERARTTDSAGGTITDFQINQRGGGTPALIVKGSGNVGIGTASPEAQLHIYDSAIQGWGPYSGSKLIIDSSSSNFINLRTQADSNQQAGIVFSDNNPSGYVIFQHWPDDSLHLGAYNSIKFEVANDAWGVYKAERMRIDSSGNVVIGTTSTSYKFQVYIDASNEGHVDSTGAWARSSDIRYKKNVSDFQDGLARIMNLRPVRYDSKTEPDSKNQGKHLGFIAQEFEKSIPELINTDQKGYKSIAYADLTVVLTKAIQEQQSQLQNQQKKIEEQESRIQKQENDIEHLKQELIGSTAMLIESNQNLQANTKEIQDLKTEIANLQKKL